MKRVSIQFAPPGWKQTRGGQQTAMSENEFEVLIRPQNKKPFIVNLSEFASGSKDSKGTHGFSGRPILAAQLANTLRLTHVVGTVGSRDTLLSGLRETFRFLDSVSTALPVAQVADFGHAHIAGLKIWADTKPGVNYQTVKIVRPVITAARRLYSLSELFWESTAHAKTSYTGISAEGIRKLYRALCKEATEARKAFKEGAELAASGVDPRYADETKRGEATDNQRSAPWAVTANQVWFIRDVMIDALIGGTFTSVRKKYRHGLERMEGPPYRVPGQSDGGGLFAGLRWLCLGPLEMAVLLGLFLIGTGWNYATAAALDIDNWCADFPLKPNLKVLQSRKDRGESGIQYALSSANSAYAPYRIVEYAIERSAPIRMAAHAALKRIANMPASDRNTFVVQKERVALEQATRSPWLFFAVSGSHIGSLSDETLSVYLMRTLKSVAEKHGICDDDGAPLVVTSRDIRKTFAEYSYGRHGYQWMLTRIALGQADEHSLNAYLSSDRLYNRGQERVRAFQDVLFGEIKDRQLVDGAALRILAENGTISVDQRQRLNDMRYRSRVGMGCVNPYSPPSEIASDHREGDLCRIQRCTLCSHGVLFPDSLDGVAMRFAELIEIKRTTPLETWMAGDFRDELEWTISALKLFPEPLRVAAIVKHRALMSSGADVPYDLEAGY